MSDLVRDPEDPFSHNEAYIFPGDRVALGIGWGVWLQMTGVYASYWFIFLLISIDSLISCLNSICNLNVD